MKLLYRTIKNKAEWTRINNDRVLNGWSHDPEGQQIASESEADAASDDIYTDGGSNTEPIRYPALIHIIAKASNGEKH